MGCNNRTSSSALKCKKIIALEGKSRQGKTTTLRMLDGMIDSRYGYKAHYQGYNGKGKDIGSLFEINGKYIAIISGGDNEEVIKMHHQRLKEVCMSKMKKVPEIDLLICACRSQGDTKKHLRNISSNVVFISIMSQKNGTDEEKNILHAHQAAILFSKIF